jgi:hypothetical protein
LREPSDLYRYWRVFDLRKEIQESETPALLSILKRTRKIELAVCGGNPIETGLGKVEQTLQGRRGRRFHD